jgi:putative transposase
MTLTGKEGLAIVVDVSLPASRFVRSLDQIIEIMFIQPGKLRKNAYVERYNRTVRYDWLNHYLFDSIEDVQNRATQWLWTYSNECPNMALNGITPMMKLVAA